MKCGKCGEEVKPEYGALWKLDGVYYHMACFPDPDFGVSWFQAGWTEITNK